MEIISSLFESNGIFLSKKTYNLIELTIDKTSKNIHISLLLDKNNHLLSHGINVYFATDKFPFSMHSEINTITKYYKKQGINRKKKKLVILKFSGAMLKLGMSAPCRNCANYILNNMDNINITEVYYSTCDNELALLKKDDLINNNFGYSSAFRKRLGLKNRI